MWGTIVNALAILVGSLVGIFIKRFFGKRLPEAYTDIVMQGVGLSVVIIGISSALKTENMLIVIISLVIGGVIGTLIGIEKKLDSVGNLVQRRFSGNSESTFSLGFVNASLIFCVGAMAIVGSLDAGLKGSYETLYAKSLLDGITSMILAATLGIGVTFSAVPVILYQGSITLLSGSLHSYLTESVINEMSAVGGILILGIGLNMLDIKKVNVGNMLPAIFIPLLYFIFV